MKNIHCHVITDGYAARVKDTKSYASVSKDILSRWTFPLVPDDNHPGCATTSYDHSRGNRYLSTGVPPHLARASYVGPMTLLGPGSSIASDARVSGSVLGANCVLEQGAVVSDSYLWDGVRVEEGAVIEGSVLGKNVTVLRGSRVERGCLIADDVIIGPDAHLRRLTRVSKKRDQQADEEEEDEEDSDYEDAEAGKFFLRTLLIPRL